MINWCNTIHTPSGFICAQWDAYFMVVQGLSVSANMEQNDSLDTDTGPLLSLTQSFHIVFFFPFCTVHNKYLETDVPTNQKVFTKYPVGSNCKFIVEIAIRYIQA